jgi:hypothetical protein
MYKKNANVVYRLIYAFVLVALLLGLGTVYYSFAESWSYVDSFYFSTITLTTIGFGDLAPTTDASKMFTAFYALIGIGVMLYILSSVIGVFIFKQEKHFDKVFSLRHVRNQEKKMYIEQQKRRKKRKKEIARIKKLNLKK